MERVKIKLPEKFSFSTILPVRITDVNYGGHVGNDRFLTLAHEARMQFLEYHGYSELEVENTSLIMNDAAIEFKNELNYGDVLKISVTSGNFHKYGFDIFYKIEIESKHTTLAAKIKTGMLFFDYNKKKIHLLEKDKLESLQQKLTSVCEFKNNT